MKCYFIGIRKAYYSAGARRESYIELPEGDREYGVVGWCLKAAPGTRDAAQCWEAEYSQFMEAIGCTRGLASPCVLRMRNVN